MPRPFQLTAATVILLATHAAQAAIYRVGSDAACTGPRPVLLYAHGTTVDKAYNIASPSNGEGGLLAAFYAAQGFIVVTSNYAGYDASRLPYHPYLNAEQQANDMVDAMRAARAAFPKIGTSESGAVQPRPGVRRRLRVAGRGVIPAVVVWVAVTG